MQKCMYCQSAFDPAGREPKPAVLNESLLEGGTRAGFLCHGIPFCSLDCWNAYGIRAWALHHKLPRDPDQLNLGVISDELFFENTPFKVAPHDPFWDVERWIRK